LLKGVEPNVAIWAAGDADRVLPEARRRFSEDAEVGDDP
jgi:hypothetical protein